MEAVEVVVIGVADVRRVPQAAEVDGEVGAVPGHVEGLEQFDIGRQAVDGLGDRDRAAQLVIGVADRAVGITRGATRYSLFKL